MCPQRWHLPTGPLPRGHCQAWDLGSSTCPVWPQVPDTEQLCSSVVIARSSWVGGQAPQALCPRCGCVHLGTGWQVWASGQPSGPRRLGRVGLLKLSHCLAAQGLGSGRPTRPHPREPPGLGFPRPLLSPRSPAPGWKSRFYPPPCLAPRASLSTSRPLHLGTCWATGLGRGFLGPQAHRPTEGSAEPPRCPASLWQRGFGRSMGTWLPALPLYLPHSPRASSGQQPQEWDVQLDPYPGQGSEKELASPWAEAQGCGPAGAPLPKCAEAPVCSPTLTLGAPRFQAVQAGS